MTYIPTPQEAYKGNAYVNRRLGDFLQAIEESISAGNREARIEGQRGGIDAICTSLLFERGWCCSFNQYTNEWTITPNGD